MPAATETPPAGRTERLRAALSGALRPRSLEIRDDSALHAGHAGAREGGHFHVAIVAECFRGLAPLARHRLVYDAVAGLMGRDIHALSIDARAPEPAATVPGFPTPQP
jgi:BolA protein